MDYKNVGLYVNEAVGLDRGNSFGYAFIEEFFLLTGRVLKMICLGFPLWQDGQVGMVLLVIKEGFLLLRLIVMLYW